MRTATATTSTTAVTEETIAVISKQNSQHARPYARIGHCDWLGLVCHLLVTFSLYPQHSIDHNTITSWMCVCEQLCALEYCEYCNNKCNRFGLFVFLLLLLLLLLFVCRHCLQATFTYCIFMLLLVCECKCSCGIYSPSQLMDHVKQFDV